MKSPMPQKAMLGICEGCRRPSRIHEGEVEVERLLDKFLRKQPRKGSSAVFWRGFGSALLLTAVLLGAGIYYLLTQGFSVFVDSEELARLVRARVVEQAKKDLPLIVENAKLQIPYIVEQEMRDQITSDRMEIAGFIFRVPDELMNQLRANMQKNVENATAEILGGINTDEVAEQFGLNVSEMVKQSLFSQLDGQVFEFKVFELLPMRVRVGVR